MPSARHFICICALIAGCSTVPKETSKGKLVKIIKSPFAETCTQLAKLKYDGTPFIHDTELNIILKELTAKAKGNAVRYDIFVPGVTGVSNAKGRATVYRCDPAKLAKHLNETRNANGDEMDVTTPEADEGETGTKSKAEATSLKAKKGVKGSGSGNSTKSAPSKGSPPSDK